MPAVLIAGARDTEMCFVGRPGAMCFSGQGILVTRWHSETSPGLDAGHAPWTAPLSVCTVLWCSAIPAARLLPAVARF